MKEPAFGRDEDGDAAASKSKEKRRKKKEKEREQQRVRDKEAKLLDASQAPETAEVGWCRVGVAGAEGVAGGGGGGLWKGLLGAVGFELRAQGLRRRA